MSRRGGGFALTRRRRWKKLEEVNGPFTLIPLFEPSMSRRRRRGGKPPVRF
jgi:hypothetical protein